MVEKRRRTPGDSSMIEEPRKKAKHGFRVGPANLPDGTYKRHNDKIKKNLIETAQIKKQYAKMKRQMDVQPESDSVLAQQVVNAQEDDGSRQPAAAEPHPDRADLMSTQVDEPDDEDAHDVPKARRQYRDRARPTAFDKQSKEAQRRKTEAEARRTAREEAERERQQRIAERERHRKIMAKARSATGQRKLGRESTVLLDKVKRLMGTT